MIHEAHRLILGAPPPAIHKHVLHGAKVWKSCIASPEMMTD